MRCTAQKQVYTRMYISTGQYKAISLRILYTWRLSVQVGISRYLSVCTITWHLMIWSVLPCTMAWRPHNKASKDKDVLVCTSTYQYILVCTCTYSYKLVHISTYQYVMVYTDIYEIHPRTDQYILVCTSTYRYRRVHTVSAKKKCKQISNPQSCA